MVLRSPLDSLAISSLFPFPMNHSFFGRLSISFLYLIRFSLLYSSFIASTISRSCSSSHYISATTLPSLSYMVVKMGSTNLFWMVKVFRVWLSLRLSFFKSFRSSSLQSVMAIPCCPALAVLPILCRYLLGSEGKLKLMTALTFEISRPRATRSVPIR